MLDYGGNDIERLFLEDELFISKYHKELISVKRTNIPGIDIEDLIVRHKARYGLVALFCRPGLKLLDFPCGSGYASKLLSEYKVTYIGAEIDSYIVEYAQKEYCKYGDFIQADLTDIKIKEKFDIIACIEGIEHIEKVKQYKALEYIERYLLNPNGVLIISMPEAKEKSGFNPNNRFHLWERTKEDFKSFLNCWFDNVQILEQENKLSTGEVQNCLYGICRKEK